MQRGCGVVGAEVSTLKMSNVNVREVGIEVVLDVVDDELLVDDEGGEVPSARNSRTVRIFGAAHTMPAPMTPDRKNCLRVPGSSSTVPPRPACERRV
jgi:hypothetical protein